MALNLINRFSRIQKEYQRVNVDAALPLAMDEKMIKIYLNLPLGDEN